MPKEHHGSHSQKARGEKHRRGIWWRLLTCSERDSNEDSEASWTASNNSEWRHKQKRRGASTIESTAADSSTSSCLKECPGVNGDGTCERRLRPQRHRERQHRYHHHGSRQRPSWTSNAAEVTPKMPKQPAESSLARRDSRRRQKRLVVAMLEDRDRDETLEAVRSSDCHGIATPDTLQLQTTRDERKIKRILHQLSATIDRSDDRAVAAAAVPNNQTPYLAQAAVPPRLPSQLQPPTQPPQLQPPTQPPQLQPPTQPPQLQPPTQPPQLQPPTQPPQLQPPTLPPELELQPEPHLVNRPQSGLAVQQQSYLSHQQFSEQLQALQGQQLNQLNQQSSFYGIRQFPQPEPAARTNRRRGYRLFRRIFSAADNYYAVPFSPLNIIKLTKDDDQWEDLEIYVSSQKGTTAIKSKKVQHKRGLFSQSGDRLPDSVRKNRERASNIPRPKDNRSMNHQRLTHVESQQSTIDPSFSAPQQEFVAYADPTEQTQLQLAQLPPQLPHQLSQQHPQQIPQQQQLMSQIPFLSRNARAKPLGIPAPGFSRHVRHQQEHQQRRAEPLSPNRLLSQLCGQQPSPAAGTRRSLLPRWEPPTSSSSQISGTGNRCGKLNNVFLPYFFP